MSRQDIVLAVAGGATNMATAGQGISILSASGQTIAGIVSAVAPIGGAIAVNPAASLITFIKVSIDASNGQVSVGDAVSSIGMRQVMFAQKAVIVKVDLPNRAYHVMEAV
ncbi:hypothetical protein [Verminephrobacter eiseniae]|uniref:hypothetical protein n=1 Tax=Verminephrobacter eiseniae TaxID=364317 RepID=UPI002238401B|nr:hypothetical protein [Verminephrobacter eiseniae]